jgi:hypothetical protein
MALPARRSRAFKMAPNEAKWLDGRPNIPPRPKRYRDEDMKKFADAQQKEIENPDLGKMRALFKKGIDHYRKAHKGEPNNRGYTTVQLNYARESFGAITEALTGSEDRAAMILCGDAYFWCGLSAVSVKEWQRAGLSFTECRQRCNRLGREMSIARSGAGTPLTKKVTEKPSRDIVSVQITLFGMAKSKLTENNLHNLELAAAYFRKSSSTFVKNDKESCLLRGDAICWEDAVDHARLGRFFTAQKTRDNRKMLMEAWKDAGLHDRQAKERLAEIVKEIRRVLVTLPPGR